MDWRNLCHGYLTIVVLEFGRLSLFQMDIEGIWRVIATYNKSFRWVWSFPVYYNLKSRRILHLPRQGRHYRLWLIIVGGTLTLNFLCTLLTLLWINFLAENPLDIFETFFCIMVLILTAFGCCIVYGVNAWMEVATATTAQMQKDFNDLVEGS